MFHDFNQRLASHFPRIVGPMEERLALAAPAGQIARPAMLLQLRHVTPDGAPSLDLAQVVRVPPARVIPAIPLEPAARIVGMNPAFLSPDFEGLRRIHSEKIQRRPMTIRRKPGAPEPARGKFLPAIGQVFSAENAEGQHLSRSELGNKTGPKFTSDRLGSPIDIALLHFVVNQDALRFHHATKIAGTAAKR